MKSDVIDTQASHLDKLIESCNKKGGHWSTGMNKVGFSLYRKNNNVLIIAGRFKNEADSKYLGSCDVISKEDIFLNIFTGCTGPESIGGMVESFDEYNDDNVINNISIFLKSLKANKIIICYSDITGGTAVLAILYKICQKLNIASIPIIIKPALFKRERIYRRSFRDLLEYMETGIYHIYDENLYLYKPNAKKTLGEFDIAVENEIIAIALSIMDSEVAN